VKDAVKFLANPATGVLDKPRLKALPGFEHQCLTSSSSHQREISSQEKVLWFIGDLVDLSGCEISSDQNATKELLRIFVPFR
jgi:hypothetical protein